MPTKGEVVIHHNKAGKLEVAVLQNSLFEAPRALMDTHNQGYENYQDAVAVVQAVKDIMDSGPSIVFATRSEWEQSVKLRDAADAARRRGQKKAVKRIKKVK